MSVRHVAVIDGGASGTLQAIELLRRGWRVTLIKRGSALARGARLWTRIRDDDPI